MAQANKTEATSLFSVMNQGIDNRIKGLHTCAPGIIISFDAPTQMASVQLAVRRQIITTEEDIEVLVPTDIAPLINVPITFPRAAGFSLTFPVEAGDECLVFFCERDIDTWNKESGVQTPNSYRQHSYSDAIAFVGIASQPNKIQNFDPVNVSLRDETADTNITMTPDNQLKLIVPNQITITSPLTVWTGDIELEGDVTQVGDYEQTGDYDLAGDIDQAGVSASFVNTGSVTVTGQTVTMTGVAGFTIVAAAGLLLTGAMVASGAIAAPSVTIGGLPFSAHVHTGVTSGSSNTGGPV